MPGAVEELAGTILALIVLLDVFLIVLYARTNTGIISRWLSHTLWRGFVAVGRRLGREQHKLLIFSGPIILLSVIASWLVLLTIALALIIHPNLGIGIKATQGQTPRDFITALYAAGTSLSFVGSSNLQPATTIFKLFYVLISFIGISLASLMITYLMQVYQNLLIRNAYGFQMHLMTGRTGDAAELIARIAPRGRLDQGYNVLNTLAGMLPRVKVSHAFYDMLFYFRFHQKYYSVSRTALVALDTVSLMRSALDDKEYGWAKESGAVEELEGGTLEELDALTRVFLWRTGKEEPPDEKRKDLWRQRYAVALNRLQQAGIKTEKDGVDKYVEMRARWDGYIRQLAPRYAYDLDEIDVALARVGEQQAK